MGLRIIGGSGYVDKDLSQIQGNSCYGLEKLSVSIQFLQKGTEAVEQSQFGNVFAKSLEFNQYKQNINDGILLTQFVESQLNTLNNILNKLKEIVVQSMNPALSDKERGYLFVEYQANYDDIINISQNFLFMQQQNFNTANLKNQQNKYNFGVFSDDVYIFIMERLNKIKTFSQDFGIPSVKNLVCAVKGVSIDDVLEYFAINEANELSRIFDRAYLELLEYQKHFVEFNFRFNHAIQVIQVAYENTVAACSQTACLDYATEMANLAKAKILVQASSGLIAQQLGLLEKKVLTLVEVFTKHNS